MFITPENHQRTIDQRGVNKITELQQGICWHCFDSRSPVGNAVLNTRLVKKIRQSSR